MFARMGLAQRLQSAGALEMQTRSVATLKTLQIRMRSIKNMQKITKAMKMVATAKFKKDQAKMEAGLPFASPVMNLFQRLPAEEKKWPSDLRSHHF